MWGFSVQMKLVSPLRNQSLAALAGAKPEVDHDHLLRYLVNGYKVLYKTPSTFFRDVDEFPAASVAALSDATPPRPRPYWSLAYRPRPMSREEALDGVRERLREAVRPRLRADVPLAFCLSGGVDSATLAAIAAKRFGQSIHCFSIIDRDPRYDESDEIRVMVDHLGCDHHVTRTSTEGFFDRMTDLVAYHDAPVATISYYVHAFLSEAIAAAGYKVAVSGTGADELFTGYYDHYSMWLAGMARERRNDPAFDLDRLIAEWRSGYGSAVRNPLLQHPLAFLDDPNQRDHILLDQGLFEGLLAVPFHEDWTERDYAPELLRNRMLNELFHESVPVLLHEDDRNSMKVSVENRSPYLDRGLAEFLNTVPSEHLIHDGFAKWLLREAAAGLVPDAVRLDKRKRGFNASIDSLVDRSDAGTRERLLAPGPIFDLVDRDAFTGFLDGDMTANSYSKFLFSFISARTFLEHHQAWLPGG